MSEKSHKDAATSSPDAEHREDGPENDKAEASAEVLSTVSGVSAVSTDADDQSEPTEMKIFNNIQKSKLDKREYRGLILTNGLRVMLISDESTNRSAVCMDVNVGSWSDPLELPGLAHFVEHQLFLGTEKYPNANDYSDFISMHGGIKNAYTSPINTNFYFDVDSDYLEPALDRFVQFFISPTFDASYMDKELNSIQSEFELNYDSDPNKRIHVARETCDQTHNYAKFNVILAKIMDKLVKFDFTRERFEKFKA